MKQFENLLVDSADGIVTITINRHPANTLNQATLFELGDVFNELDRDGTARVIIVTGAGEQFFCGGTDLKELRTAVETELADRGQQIFQHIETLSKPVIAAINGLALGGGCELAMSCHLRVAADTARLGHPEVTFGMMPCWGGTQRLPRLIGRTRALEMLLTGRLITAAESERFGLVNLVVPAAELGEATRKLAQRLIAAGPLAQKEILACVDTGLNEGPQKGWDAERNSFNWISQTEDATLGLRAFLTKQKPHFQGR